MGLYKEFGRKATEEELEEKYQNRAADYKVTEEDIEAAFNRGDEVLISF